MPHITKETFLEALECRTRAWLNLRAGGGAPSPGDLLRMEQGMEVHRRARALLPGAVRVREAEMTAAAGHTRRLMADPARTVILEAAFLVDGYATRADILAREGSGWRMTEIKSGVNEESADYLADIAYTVMVMTRARAAPAGVTLKLLSRDFRLGMDDAALFADYDNTAFALPLAAEYATEWEPVRDTVLGDEPPAPLLKGACRGCPYFGDCFPGLDNPVTELYRLKSTRIDELVSAGVPGIEQLPAGIELSAVQERIRAAVRTGRAQVADSLAGELAAIAWPARYLDFESMQSAIPLYEDVAPQEMLPTQYSIHEASGPGKVTRHREYIADPARDPRRPLAERLLEDLGDEGGIITYSGFEKRVLNNLAARFPDLAGRLAAAVERIVDLLGIVNRNYYHPGFHGSFSIKRVLPVLVPSMSYDDLEIGEGDTASAIFTRAAMGQFTAGEWAKHRRDLLTYCAQDTMAMVELHDRLQRVAR